MLAESKHLPTAISLDHKIPMILEAKSVNIRLYKISFMQKKIEKLVKKMLHN